MHRSNYSVILYDFNLHMCVCVETIRLDVLITCVVPISYTALDRRQRSAQIYSTFLLISNAVLKRRKQK